jgi:hypothetical protein
MTLLDRIKEDKANGYDPIGTDDRTKRIFIVIIAPISRTLIHTPFSSSIGKAPLYLI